MKYVPVGTQRDLIETDAPVVVALGGAGTGKTVTAAAAASAHLSSKDVQREALRRAMIDTGQVRDLVPRARVLFLTFSRTAVTQVTDRAAAVVGRMFDRIDVVTFHGFAWRILNDWGPAYGYPPPLRVVSSAETKVPGATAGFRYEQLIPAARHVLEQPAVNSHYARRYSLLVCDEFQDTNDEEWEFFQSIAPQARRIVLGDINQCIYADLKRINPDRRISKAMELPGAVRISLPAASQRDPSGVLPAAAEAARDRRFNDPAVVRAVTERRLTVIKVDEETSSRQVMDLVKSECADGHTVSVFTHTNVSATQLSDDFTAAGVRHEQIGFLEAYAEALNAQLAMILHALQGAPARRELAIFVAANHRAKAPLVTQIVHRSDPNFERALAAVAADLRDAGRRSDWIGLSKVISGAYARLGTNRGQQTWDEAARRTSNALRRMGNGIPPEELINEINGARNRALIGGDDSLNRPIQVMNLHQTKGREADVTVLRLQPGEYHGQEGPPYPQLSKLLYVVLTRARLRAHILVSHDVHPLWLPLIEACQQIQASDAR